jgi:tyrosyl-tRNA synthetase
VVQKGEAPADMETARIPEDARTPGGIRLPKLLAAIGLAESVSDATRKIKAGAVEIDGLRVTEISIPDPHGEMVVRAGRNWRKVVK